VLKDEGRRLIPTSGLESFSPDTGWSVLDASRGSYQRKEAPPMRAGLLVLAEMPGCVGPRIVVAVPGPERPGSGRYQFSANSTDAAVEAA
jgi:hypothetical protein